MWNKDKSSQLKSLTVMGKPWVPKGQGPHPSRQWSVREKGTLPKRPGWAAVRLPVGECMAGSARGGARPGHAPAASVGSGLLVAQPSPAEEN